MGGLIGALGIVLLIGGLVPIVRPTLVGLRRRRHAVALWSLWYVLVATGGALTPQTASEEASAGAIWALSMTFYALAWAVSWWICRRLDARGRQATANPVSVEIESLRHIAARQSVRKIDVVVTEDRDAYADDDLTGSVNRAVELRFDYVDRDGVVTTRAVIDWIDTRFYVKGMCLERYELRTFRKDRVDRWLAGQQALLHGLGPRWLMQQR